MDGPAGALALRAARLPVATALALLALVATAAFAAWYGVDGARHLRSDIEAAGRLDSLGRAAAPARVVGLDASVLVQAATVISTDETFQVMVGRRGQSGPALLVDGLAPLAAYWLLPRRRASDSAVADWILAYGTDLDELGLRFDSVVDLGSGVRLARVRR